MTELRKLPNVLRKPVVCAPLNHLKSSKHINKCVWAFVPCDSSDWIDCNGEKMKKPDLPPYNDPPSDSSEDENARPTATPQWQQGAAMSQAQSSDWQGRGGNWENQFCENWNQWQQGWDRNKNRNKDKGNGKKDTDKGKGMGKEIWEQRRGI